MGRFKTLCCVLLAVACSDAVSGSQTDAGVAQDAQESGTPDSGADAAACVPGEVGTACSILPQCGCQADHSCLIAGATSGVAATACVPTGNVPRWHSCTATQCQRGTQCVFNNCAPYCDPSHPCDNGGECINAVYLDNGELKLAGYSICTANCPLENPSAVCGPGLNCVYYSGPDVPHTGCIMAGSGTGPGSCADVTECAPGYACVGQGDCRKWCRLGTDTDCFAGETCKPLGVQFIVHGVAYGACY